jgi:hypothetical protein
VLIGFCGGRLAIPVLAANTLRVSSLLWDLQLARNANIESSLSFGSVTLAYS